MISDVYSECEGLKPATAKFHRQFDSKIMSSSYRNTSWLQSTASLSALPPSLLLSFFSSPFPKMFVHCLTCGSVCAQRSRHGAETGSLCESAGGPPALLYAGAQREGIIDTETNSLSSQPPQNRNTPIIKEREGEGERERERESEREREKERERRWGRKRAREIYVERR